jgi:hypothetical protein
VYNIAETVSLTATQTITGSKTFTAQTNVQSDGANGNLRLSPATGTGESALGLYYNSNRSMATDGDLWLISNSSEGQVRRFAIYSQGSSPTARLTIQTSGLVSIPGTLSVTGQTTCGVLNATQLQVNGVNISSTYATQSALTAKQDSLTVISTNVPC